VRVGLVVGGITGTGVLLARKGRGKGWSQPAFYDLSGATLGLQAGAEVSEAVFPVMSDKGLNSLLTPKVKLGGGVSVAGGSQGQGQGQGATMDADFLILRPRQRALRRRHGQGHARAAQRAGRAPLLR
jgi:lipid-binding SYLF domain-containing protein